MRSFALRSLTRSRMCMETAPMVRNQASRQDDPLVP